MISYLVNVTNSFVRPIIVIHLSLTICYFYCCSWCTEIVTITFIYFFFTFLRRWG